MRITSHPLRGSAAAKAVRNSKAFDPTVRLHLRFAELNDVPFIAALSPGPSPAARRRWIHHCKSLEAEGDEFNFIVVENGRDQGLVRMHDFAVIGGEASFRWADFISHQPGLLTATVLTIYSLGFDTLGYGRAHMTVPRTRPDLSAFHVSTGAELEFDDGDYLYYRFGAETYDRVRNDALQRLVVTVPPG